MATDSPRTIEAYIRAALPQARPHLTRMADLLRSVAPDAEAVIKWKHPFSVEPRLVFAFSEHKAHLGIAPSPSTLDISRDDLGDLGATKFTLRIPYDTLCPEGPVRTIAEHQLLAVSRREGDSFW